MMDTKYSKHKCDSKSGFFGLEKENFNANSKFFYSQMSVTNTLMY